MVPASTLEAQVGFQQPMIIQRASGACADTCGLFKWRNSFWQYEHGHFLTRQLSRFAEKVSQALQSGRLCVNKSKLEVLVGAAGPGARRINAEIARRAYQFIVRGETIRATTVVKYLGNQVESQRRGTDAGHHGHQGPSSIFSWTLGTSFHGIEHQNQAVADAGSGAFCCMQQKLMRGFRETLKRWKSVKTVHYDTQDLRKRLGVHTVVSTLQVRRILWAKKRVREETDPEEERTGAGEAMIAMVFGRLSFEKGQAPSSRFVRQFLEDLDDLRRFVCEAEEGDRAVEDARIAADLLGIDLPRENPSRDQKWEWLLAVPESEVEEASKKHLQQWCGQCDTETQGVERVKKCRCHNET